jgi:hypothetical protein
MDEPAVYFYVGPVVAILRAIRNSLRELALLRTLVMLVLCMTTQAKIASSIVPGIAIPMIRLDSPWGTH